MSRPRTTRGKTAPGRLVCVDPILVSYLQGAGPEPLVVDVGIGSRPETTLELHAALRAVSPDVRTLGLDTDPERVAALAACEVEGIEARLGGFDAVTPGSARLVRAMNLLRQYRLESVAGALGAMHRWLAPSGVLVEGTTDKQGTRGVVRVLRAQDPPGGVHAYGFFCTTLHGFAPRALTPYLPRGLGWHGHPGPELEPFFALWTQAFERARVGGATTAGDLFEDSVRALIDAGDVPVGLPWAGQGGRFVVEVQATPSLRGAVGDRP